MLRRRRQREAAKAVPAPPPDPLARDGADLVAEAQAFVDGRLLDVLHADGRPVRGWVWLNQLAHGQPGDVIALALDAPGGGAEGGWRAARAAVALELLAHSEGSLDRLAELQRDILVPLELELAAGSVSRLTPTGLLALVRSELGGWVDDLG